METNNKQEMGPWTRELFERPSPGTVATGYGYPEPSTIAISTDDFGTIVPSTPEPGTTEPGTVATIAQSAVATMATELPAPTVTDVAETGVVLAVAVAALSFAYTFIRESVRNAQAERNGFLEYLKATITEQQKEYQQIFAQMRTRDEHYLRVLRELSQDIKDSNNHHR